jgi:hypothetical protein
MPHPFAHLSRSLMHGPVFDRFADYLGAQSSPERAKQERHRALLRAAAGVAVASVWLAQHLAGPRRARVGRGSRSSSAS